MDDEEFFAHILADTLPEDSGSVEKLIEHGFVSAEIRFKDGGGVYHIDKTFSKYKVGHSIEFLI